MVQIRKMSALLAAVIAAAACTNAVHADVVASDNATNPAYAPDATPTPADALSSLNGGSGFGPWVVTETANAGGSTGNGFAYASSLNTTVSDQSRNLPPVFDILDNGGSTETAARSLTAPLTVGGSFSFVDTLHNLNGSGAGTAGFQLLDATGNVLLNLSMSGGGTGWVVTDAFNNGVTSPVSHLLGSTDSAHSGAAARDMSYNFQNSDTVSIQLLDTTTLANGDLGADYQIVTGGHEGSTFGAGTVGPNTTFPTAFTQSLQIDMSTGGPAAFDFYNNNGGAGSDFAVNALAESAATPTPEPASLALAALALPALLLRRRRAL